MLKTVVTIGGGGGSGNGTVTQIDTGTGLTGGPITTTGIISTANIPNSSLSNSSVTIGNTAVSLGSTTTTVGNLSLGNANITSVAVAFPNSFLANSTSTLGNATLTLGSITSTVGNLTLNNVTINSGNNTVTNATVSYANITTAFRTVPLTGYLYGNANTGNVTAATTVPNSGLANSSTTLGNTALTLGSTVTSVGNLTLTNVIISSFSSSPSSAAWIVNSNNVNVQTNTSYTLVSSDNGKVVTCNNSSAITVTVPANLGAGFSCLLVQLGTGNVKPTANSTTINANGGKSNTNGQYSVVSLYAYAADTFLMSGNMQ